jgi:hypothetical protein
VFCQETALDTLVDNHGAPLRKEARAVRQAAKRDIFPEYLYIPDFEQLHPAMQSE